ncbi:MAG TPA: hypothetical protein VMU81_30125 [Acetobacteraceae bacterium]|nr:hypothetical protein [Acetobacteraceae bacterium]
MDDIAQKPIEGVSMTYTFDQANAEAPTTHTTQYRLTITLDPPKLTPEDQQKLRNAYSATQAQAETPDRPRMARGNLAWRQGGDGTSNPDLLSA